MKVLFITEKVVVEPLGIMYLASALEGHKVDIIQIDKENLEERIEEGWDYACFSVITGNEEHWKQVAKRLPSSVVKAWGGPHVTFNPEGFGGVVVRGEGERIFRQIVDASVQGGVFWDKELQPIDSFAPPRRDILYNRHAYLWNNSIHNFISERGCPHRCSFCYNRKWNELHKGQPVVRVRNPEAVAEEIAMVSIQYPAMIYPWFVCDHFFGADKKKLYEFQKYYKRKLPIFCSMRADNIDEDMVGLLKASGVYCVNMALEAANDFMRNQVLKKDLRKEAVVRAIKLLKGRGIHVRLQNIIGLPCEDPLKDAHETLEFNHKTRPDVSWSSILQPYPGTEIEMYCRNRGY